MMRLLVEEFESLSNLVRYAPLEEHLHPIATSEVVPMEPCSGMKNILKKIAIDANLYGSPQV